MASLKFIMDVDDEEHDPRVTEHNPGVLKTSKGPNPPIASPGNDPSRPPTSSHENPQDLDDRLTPAQTKRRGPSGRSTKPTATASSSSTTISSARPSPARRRSTDSIESTMDPTRYGGPGQSSSSGMTPSGRTNMPSRPVPNVPGEGNLPVKLTPITGRVSRAKKGMPVHTCEICRPSKTFTRAEHLRRHQLSHKTPAFRCEFPGCEKTFHRADLLARHSQRHEQDGKSSRGTDGSRRHSEVSLEDATHGMGFMPHQSMGEGSGSHTALPTQPDMSSGSSYTRNTPSYQQMSNQGSGSGQTPMSPPQHPDRRGSYTPQSTGPSHLDYVLSSEQQLSMINNPVSSIGGSPIAGTPYGIDYNQPRTSSPFPVYIGPQGLSHHLPSLTIPDNNVPGLLPTATETSPWPSSASDSNFSTPSDGHTRLATSDWPMYQPGAAPSLHSPGIEAMTSAEPFFNTFSPSHPYPRYEPMLELPTSFPDERSLLDPTHPYPYSSVRSPTPPPVSLSAQTAENLVTLAAPSIPGGSSILGRQKESAATLGPYSGAAFLTAITISRPIRSAIPEYLDVYWKRFDNLFPLVHRRSLEPAADEVLQCAMAAVGTQYLQGKEDRIRGNTLHEFAWQEAKRFPQWNVRVMQAILLCEFYARFRGRKAVYRPSQPFQSLYSRVSTQYSPSPPFSLSVGSLTCSFFQDYLFSFVLSSPIDRWHLYSTSLSSQVANSQSPDNYTSSAATREERWHEWIEAESRRRLLAACFVLDTHTSIYHEQPPIHTYTVPTPPIPLTRRSKDLWDARTSEEWETVITSTPPDLEPATLSEEVNLTPERVATAPPLDRAVFLASEMLRLPRRPSPTALDLSADLNLASTERISQLFPGSAVANTYLALHYTPLHDLLAVSGDSWLFSQKELDSQKFQQRQKRLKLWSGSPHAGAAAGFAAKALLAFLDDNNSNNNNNNNNNNHNSDNVNNDNTTTTTTATTLYSSPTTTQAQESTEKEKTTRERRKGGHGSTTTTITTTDTPPPSTRKNNTWNTSDMSDYWALYVCALICWALNHRATTTTTTTRSSTTRSSSSSAIDRSEREARAWLAAVAGAATPDGVLLLLRARGAPAVAVVGAARRRLEDEAAGAGKSMLLVDALGVLRKLEEGAGRRWF
ncbi:hypothetical protein F4809DRAFT_584278 [Biscogniauxia mediterranea]|nr:hypothetical protein F4809DRAFT_584278 [Biscogniauxia mediterranea]